MKKLTYLALLSLRKCSLLTQVNVTTLKESYE